MKIRIIGVLVILTMFTACIVIPKETVTLSQTLGNDLVILQKAHRNIIDIHFKKINNGINSFVDNVYAPYAIHRILESDLKNYKAGKPSLYLTVEIAGQKEGKIESENALNEMTEFQNSARRDIESERNELLKPILKQQEEIVLAVNQSYEHALYANSTVTAYLQSIRNVKGAQQEALSMLNLSGADTLITNSLVKISEQVENAVNAGKKIDIQSDDASNQLEKISNQIKAITNKK